MPKSAFMPVYGEIDYDGRVQRAAEALSDGFDVTVFSVHSGLGYRNSKFSIEAIKLAGLQDHRVIKFVCFCLWLIVRAVRFRPYLIYAHDGYTATPSWIAARLTGARLVYDAHELNLPDDGVFASRRQRLLYWLERPAIKRADLVIAANTERAALMRTHHRLKGTPLVIRNISSLPKEVFGPEETLRRYPALRQSRPRAVRLVYQGFMSLGIGPFISALRGLPDRFELLLVGSGLGMKAIRRQVETEGLTDRVIFLDKVPREHLHDILTTCDIGIISYINKTLNQRYCAPNKVYEYAQAGLPIIATCQLPLKSLNETYRIGVLVGCGQGSADDLVGEIGAACVHLADAYETYKARLPKFLADHRWETEGRRLLRATAGL